MVQSKEVHREYMRNKRKGSQNGSQVEGSQGEVHILSDGQVWYPDLKIKKEAEKVFNDRVEYMGELRGDLEARKERVERYSKWRVGKGSMGNVEPLKVG